MRVMVQVSKLREVFQGFFVGWHVEVLVHCVHTDLAVVADRLCQATGSLGGG